MPSMMFRWVILHSTDDTSTALVEMTSLRLSAAVAIRVSDSMIRPTRRLKKLIHSFTRMEAHSTPTVSRLKPTSSGWRTLPADSFSRLRPMAIIMVLTARPATYSYRAWP